MEQPTQTDEAPVETGAENTNADLSLNELASSFMERVETKAEEETEPEATEEVTESEVAETEEEDDGSDLSQSDEEDEDEDAEDDQPKSVQKLLKQVSRLTARSKGAEEEVAELKAQVESLKTQPTQEQDSTDLDLNDMNTIQDLENHRKKAQAAKSWALSHVGKDYVEEDGKEYDGDEIRSILREADKHLTDLIPKRASYLFEKQQWAEDTRTVFPYVGKQDGANYESFVQIRNSEQYKPILDSLPNGDFIAGVIVEGMASIEARQKAKPKAKVKTPPVTDIGDSIAPPVQSKKVRQQKKKEAIVGKSGAISVDQLAAFLT